MIEKKRLRILKNAFIVFFVFSYMVTLSGLLIFVLLPRISPFRCERFQYSLGWFGRSAGRCRSGRPMHYHEEEPRSVPLERARTQHNRKQKRRSYKCGLLGHYWAGRVAMVLWEQGCEGRAAPSCLLPWLPGCWFSPWWWASDFQI